MKMQSMLLSKNMKSKETTTTDKYNGPVNSDPSSSSTYEQGSNEYSSYDNYEPSDYGNSYDSSYSNDELWC